MSGIEGYDPAILTALAGGAALAGKGASDWDIEAAAGRLLRMAGDGARPAQRLARYGSDDLVRFPAILLSAEKEPSTTRPLLLVYTKPSKNYPTGIEPIRGDRTDNQGGELLLAEAQKVIGHKVLVWKVMEKMADGSGQEVRICLWVQNLGVPKDGTPDAEWLAEALKTWGKPLGTVSGPTSAATAPREAPAPSQRHEDSPGRSPARTVPAEPQGADWAFDPETAAPTPAPMPAQAPRPVSAPQPTRAPAREMTPDAIRESLRERTSDILTPSAPAAPTPRTAPDDGMPPTPKVEWSKSLRNAFGAPDDPPHENQLRNIAVTVGRLGWKQAEGHDYVFAWVLSRLGYEMLAGGAVSFKALRSNLDAQVVYKMLEGLREKVAAAKGRAS